MKKIALIVTLCSISFATQANPKISIGTWYDSSDRSVYVTTNGSSATVYFTGKNLITGNCMPPMSNVRSMKFIPKTQIKQTIKGQVKGTAQRNGLGASGFASSKNESSYQTPALFSYNYTGFYKQLHFNVVVTDPKTGKKRSTGWKPDSAGGCTYKVPTR